LRLLLDVDGASGEPAPLDFGVTSKKLLSSSNEQGSKLSKSLPISPKSPSLSSSTDFFDSPVVPVLVGGVASGLARGFWGVCGVGDASKDASADFSPFAHEAS
jgi:hypothetical protein